MKRFYILLAILITLSCSVSISEAQVVNIPDPNLALAIRDALGIAENVPITREAMRSLRKLRASVYEINELTHDDDDFLIFSISGLEHAINLEVLDISHHDINDFRPLAQLTQVTELEVSIKSINELSRFVDLTRLKGLSLISPWTLDTFRIPDLHRLSNLTQLTKLGILAAEVRDLSFLKGLTSLRGLDLQLNQISDLRPLAGLTQLEWLLLTNNQIRDVSPLAGLTNLETLLLAENPVQNAAALSNLPSLEEVDISIPPTISIRKENDFAELPRVGEAPEYLVVIQHATDVVGLNLSYITPHKLASINWVGWFDGVEHNQKNNRIGTLTASGLPTGKSSHNVAVLSLNAIAAGEGVLVVRGSVTTTSGTVNLNTQLPLTIFPKDSSETCPQLLDPNNHGDIQFVNVEAYEPESLSCLKSVGSDSDTSVVFENQSGSPITYYWVDYEGNEQSYGRVALGKSARQSSYVGNLWLIKGADGSNLAVFRATSKKGRVTIGIEAAPSEPIVEIGAAKRPAIYWVDAEVGTLHRLVGEQVENLVPGVQNVTSSAIDPKNSKIYWTEQTGKNKGNIKRANLDGSNVQTLKTLQSVPKSITVDAIGRKLYWTNSRGAIQQANLNGKPVKNLIQNLNAPANIIVDNAGGKLYWTENTGHIRRAELNGNGVEDIANNLGAVTGIAISGNKIYWAETTGENSGKIVRANLNGSNSGTLTQFQASVMSFAIDTAGRKLYWSDTAGNIHRSNLNGKGIQKVVSGLTTPVSLTVGNSGDQVAAAPVQDSLAAAQSISPETTSLLVNYPNPFNPETWIPYRLAESTDVTINIYNSSGILVRALRLGHQPAGYYTNRIRSAYWDGRNAAGERVASGIYFYQLQTDTISMTRKMVILK